MMAAPAIPGLIERWAHFYGDRKLVSAAVTYIHLAGILLGGGLAVSSDRASLQITPDHGTDVQRDLARLYSVHRLVLGGLALTITSGLLMLFADLQTFLASPLYWSKMGLVALLLANGYIRLRAEEVLRRGGAAWLTFRRTSAISLALWFLILLAGAFLTTVS